eukprot:240610-Rhodomonas_salina.1
MPSELLLKGSNFYSSDTFSIQAGPASPNCRVHNSSFAHCHFRTDTIGENSLEASNDGITFVPSTATLTVVQIPTVLNLAPTAVDVTGGLVTIFGSHFRENFGFSCGLDETTLAATVVSSSLMVCNLPRHETGGAPIAVTINQPKALSWDFAISFVDSATVAYLHPTAGPLSGGSLLTIFGSGFVPGLVACSFNGIEALRPFAATNSTVVCEPPARKDTGPVSVVVWNDGIGHPVDAG